MELENTKRCMNDIEKSREEKNKDIDNLSSDYNNKDGEDYYE